MKNNITELVFIVDKSGSMFGFEQDTVGGINSTLQKQREGEGEVLVTTILFNNRTEVVHDRLPIDRVTEMNPADYEPMGTTALLDALGEAITHVKTIHKYARKEDVPNKTIFVVTTDGKENASHRFSYSQIKRMIEIQQTTCGWEFIFLAANIDAAETAESIGIHRSRAAKYNVSHEGVEDCYNAISCYISASRRGNDRDDEWKNALNDK